MSFWATQTLQLSILFTFWGLSLSYWLPSRPQSEAAQWLALWICSGILQSGFLWPCLKLLGSALSCRLQFFSVVSWTSALWVCLLSQSVPTLDQLPPQGPGFSFFLPRPSCSAFFTGIRAIFYKPYIYKASLGDHRTKFSYLLSFSLCFVQHILFGTFYCHHTSFQQWHLQGEGVGRIICREATQETSVECIETSSHALQATESGQQQDCDHSLASGIKDSILRAFIFLPFLCLR